MKNDGFYKTKRMIWLAGILGLRCVPAHGFTLGINELSAIHPGYLLENIMIPVETKGMIETEDHVVSHAIKVEKGFAEMPKGVGLRVTFN